MEYSKASRNSREQYSTVNFQVLGPTGIQSRSVGWSRNSHKYHIVNTKVFDILVIKPLFFLFLSFDMESLAYYNMSHIMWHVPCKCGWFHVKRLRKTWFKKKNYQNSQNVFCHVYLTHATNYVLSVALLLKYFLQTHYN